MCEYVHAAHLDVTERPASRVAFQGNWSSVLPLNGRHRNGGQSRGESVGHHVTGTATRREPLPSGACRGADVCLQLVGAVPFVRFSSLTTETWAGPRPPDPQDRDALLIGQDRPRVGHREGMVMSHACGGCPEAVLHLADGPVRTGTAVLQQHDPVAETLDQDGARAANGPEVRAGTGIRARCRQRAHRACAKLHPWPARNLASAPTGSSPPGSTQRPTPGRAFVPGSPGVADVERWGQVSLVRLGTDAPRPRSHPLRSESPGTRVDSVRSI
jgi:hypothetical protein